MKKIGIIFVFAILLPIHVCCQNEMNVYDKYGLIYTSMNDSVIIYNTSKGEKLEVKLNQISFLDGDNKLVEYLKKEYYKPRPEDDDYPYRLFFFMLFDSSLKIKEIRGYVLPVNQFSDLKKKRIKLYKKGLKHTNSKWIKKTEQKWYVYYFSFITD